MDQNQILALLTSLQLSQAIEILESLVVEGILAREDADIILIALQASSVDAVEPGQETARRIDQLEDNEQRESLVDGVVSLLATSSILIAASANRLAQRESVSADNIADEFDWQIDDVKRLEAEIKRIRYSAYRDKMRQLANDVGCSEAASRAKAPSGGSKRAIDKQSNADAKSIANTWNNDVKRESQKLTKNNPDQSPEFYAEQMQAWANSRNKWKQPQISLMTVQMARQLAVSDFNESNKGDIQYRYTGPPPRSPECAELMAMGVVGVDVVRGNPTPIHFGCVHSWDIIVNGDIDCDGLFLG